MKEGAGTALDIYRHARASCSGNSRVECYLGAFSPTKTALSQNIGTVSV